MPRLNPIQRNAASEEVAKILDSVQSKLGAVPNLIATMAQSPAVAKAYLNFSGALHSGTLSSRLQEQISLLVGQENQCDYCLAAHSTIGKRVGLTQTEIEEARRGSAENPAENAALVFAQKIVRSKGQVSTDDVDQLRRAGFEDGEIAEIVGNIALNVFTNYFNHVADTEIDFPRAPELVGAS